MVATPTNRQKNEMLLSIIQEHVSPHTDSLMAVIARFVNLLLLTIVNDGFNPIMALKRLKRSLELLLTYS
jgi:hypothetical protein